MLGTFFFVLIMDASRCPPNYITIVICPLSWACVNVSWQRFGELGCLGFQLYIVLLCILPKHGQSAMASTSKPQWSYELGSHVLTSFALRRNRVSSQNVGQISFLPSWVVRKRNFHHFKDSKSCEDNILLMCWSNQMCDVCACRLFHTHWLQ